MGRFPQLSAIIAVVVTLSTSSVVKSPNDGTFELLILHNNDMHARFEQTSQLSGACTTADREAGKCYGGFPRVATVVKEARAAAASGQGPPVLYLNAGDTYTGTAWFTIYKWKVAAEFLNALQPDAVSLGNHEFDDGVSGLTPFIESLTCPILAANLILDKEPALQAEHNLMKSLVFKINGTKVGIIGYLTPETKVLAIRNDVEYIEEVNAIQEEARKLKSVGVNILIALGHSGFTKDLEIAKKVDDIDLVIGGHTNTFLWNGITPDTEKPQDIYPVVVKHKSGKIALVVQAYAYTKYLGKLNIIFDSQGEIVKYEGNPILLDKNIPQDPDILTIIHKYQADVLKISEVVLGNTLVVLDGLSCRLKECNLGNLITDAMVNKYASEYHGDGWTDAPIAILQGGGIRASIKHIHLPADITKGELLTVMPFSGHLMKMTLKGSILWKMLEHSVAYYNVISTPGQFLQVSGLKVEYDLKKPPGRRVQKVEALCGICETPIFAPVNKNVDYNIIAPSFLALGGDGYSMLKDVYSEKLNYSELDATTEYVQKFSPIHTATEGRIQIYNADKLANSAFITKLSAVGLSLSFLTCILFNYSNVS